MIPTARCLAARPPGFFKRSSAELGRLTRIITNLETLAVPTKPYKLLEFEDESTTAACKTMADRAVGGFSTAELDYIPASATDPAHARFHGSISTKLPNNWRVERTGYAAFRNRDRGAWMFGKLYWDVDPYAYLALRVKSDGRRYMINIQTESIVNTDIHQHRLYTKHHRVSQQDSTPFSSPLAAAAEASEVSDVQDTIYPGGIPPSLSDIPPAETIITGSTSVSTTGDGSGWETVFLPFKAFVRTNHGEIMEPQHSIIKNKIKSVGIGLIDRIEGPYDLRIHSIWATNGMSEAEIEEERRICGENAREIDQDTDALNGTAQKSLEKGQSDNETKEKETKSKTKGLAGLRGEWEK